MVGRNGGWVDDWSEWRLGNWLIRMEARLMIGRNGGWVDDLNWGQVVSWNYQLGSNVGLVVGRQERLVGMGAELMIGWY